MPPMGHLSQIRVKINTAESAIMHVNPYKSKHTMDVIRFMLMLKLDRFYRPAKQESVRD